MSSAEWGAPKTVESSAEWSGLWGGMSPAQPNKGFGGVVSSPSGVRGRAPAGGAFWCILKITECSFLHLYADALRVRQTVFHVTFGGKADIWETLPQRRTAPATFAHIGLSISPISDLYSNLRNLKA